MPLTALSGLCTVCMMGRSTPSSVLPRVNKGRWCACSRLQRKTNSVSGASLPLLGPRRQPAAPGPRSYHHVVVCELNMGGDHAGQHALFPGSLISPPEAITLHRRQAGESPPPSRAPWTAPGMQCTSPPARGSDSGGDLSDGRGYQCPAGGCAPVNATKEQYTAGGGTRCGRLCSRAGWATATTAPPASQPVTGIPPARPSLWYTNAAHLTPPRGDSAAIDSSLW